MACQSMAYHSAASLETAPMAVAIVICYCLLCRFASFSRVKHLREVGPLSRPVMWSMRLTQPVSAPLPKSGVKFVIFLQIGPKIDTCSQNLCSSRSNFTTVASAFQRFQLVNSTQYLLGLLSNEGRVD